MNVFDDLGKHIQLSQSLSYKEDILWEECDISIVYTLVYLLNTWFPCQRESATNRLDKVLPLPLFPAVESPISRTPVSVQMKVGKSKNDLRGVSAELYLVEM